MKEYSIYEASTIEYSQTVQSNEVVVNLSKAELKVEKSANKKEVAIGDTISYTVKVTNDGDVIAYNIIFKDELSGQTTFIPGTFKVNGIVINIENLEEGTNIPSINPGESSVVTYEVKVTNSNCKGFITNQAIVEFDYRLPDGTGGTEVVRDKAASVDVILQISQFKQVSVSSYLTVPEAKPDIEAIDSVTGTVDICNYHVVETIQGLSQEGQQLTGYKLVVTGKIKLSVEYTALGIKHGIYSAYYSVPFSVFIILPFDYQIGSNLDITGIVEDVYYNVIDIRNFFINATILINGNIIRS